MLEAIFPYIVSGLVAGAVSFITMRIDQSYLRRDVDRLRDELHGPQNPNSIRNVLQDHENRVTVLETIEERRT